MTKHQADSPVEENTPDTFVRVWHLFALILCFVALASGDLADDYEKMKYFGFLVHGWAGLGFSFALCCYLVYGLAGPRQAWFFKRPPFNRKQFGQALTELKGLARLRLPDHRNKQGLVGLLQYIGILIFGWQALTGCILYLFIEPGHRISAMARPGRAPCPTRDLQNSD